MSWNEFVIKSLGYNRIQENNARLVRIIAYEIYTVKFIFGKKKPRSIDKFWPIGKKMTSRVSEDHKKAFFSKLYEYQAAKNKE